MKVLLALLLAAAVTGCSEPSTRPTPAPTPSTAPATPTPSPRATLADLPSGDPPRIGYLARRTWVAPDGRRTRLPLRYGVSGMVPYAGGFLVADDRYFEGSVGLWFVTGAEARDLRGCSSGPPRQADGWVWWVIAHCPESLDIVRAGIHRARPDGSDERVRILRAGPRENLLLTAGAALDRVVPPRRWVREDATHRLAVVDQRGWTAVVRIDDTGRRELATTPGPTRARPSAVRPRAGSLSEDCNHLAPNRVWGV